jgi:tRNA A58 N-methylase Trm61
MTVLEPGPGLGFFTLELARLVGPAGRVVAVEIQARLVEGLKRRAARAGLLARLDARLASPASLGLDDLQGRIDFALAFAVVHEMPAGSSVFAEVTAALKAGGTLLLVEPRGHIPRGAFDDEVAAAALAGLRPTARPHVPLSRAALLQKP